VIEDTQRLSSERSDPPANAAATPRLPMPRIWLCADDYGISPGVSAAICELIARGRLNATSAMVVAPSFGPQAAAQLANRAAGKSGVAIGLHLTMTAPFRPLTAFAPLARDGTFLPISDMLVRAFWPRFDRALVGREIEAQIEAFVAAFGRPPDYVDGHHHVHLLPRVSEAVLAAMKKVNPSAWARQCGQVTPLAGRLHDRKGLVIDFLSRRFRARARALGVPTNPAFAGTYRFRPDATFAGLFPNFLDGLPEGSVVMCHPGFVDAELERLDSLTTLREKEFAFLASDEFPAVLAARGFSLG
jgi:predicted glycoside hydrolase/deacetylase ChbG (UPF0249 family)